MRSKEALDPPEALVLTMVLVAAADGGIKHPRNVMLRTIAPRRSVDEAEARMHHGSEPAGRVQPVDAIPDLEEAVRQGRGRPESRRGSTARDFGCDASIDTHRLLDEEGKAAVEDRGQFLERPVMPRYHKDEVRPAARKHVRCVGDEVDPKSLRGRSPSLGIQVAAAGNVDAEGGEAFTVDGRMPVGHAHERDLRLHRHAALPVTLPVRERRTARPSSAPVPSLRAARYPRR